MALVLLPGYRITDDNGTPVSGGKLYVFEAGTSNPRDVFTDSGLTTVHSHPIVADAAGLLPDIWTAEDDLKLRVTDAADVTIWEIDDYSTGPASSGTANVDRDVLSKTANYTVQAADKNAIIAMDASGIAGLQGDVTADSATLGAGFVIGVKNVGASGNTLFQGTGSQTVDAASNRLLTTQYEFMDLVSRGAAGWFVLASQGASDVSVTVQQADASSDGELVYENELGTARWKAVHKQTSDDYQVDRYNSGGSLVETAMKIAGADGKGEFTQDFSFLGLLISSSGKFTFQRFTASGNYVKPTADNYLGSIVIARGEGGAGDDYTGTGSAGLGGGGGGGGALALKWYADADLSASEAFTITSTATTFKSMVANDGGNASGSTGGTGGAASGGDLNISGNDGQDGGGLDIAGTRVRFGGAGGASFGQSGGASGYGTGAGGSITTQAPADSLPPGVGGGGGEFTQSGGTGELIAVEVYS